MGERCAVATSGWAIGLAALVIAGCSGEPGSSASAEQNPGGQIPSLTIPLPDFSLTERSGKTITLPDLAGKVWVADFIFTRCPGPCPRMSERFADLQQAFSRLDDVRLVSISVDPDHDTPEVLTKYAQSYGADPQRWLFLTGNKEAIVSLAVKGFKIAADEKEPNLHGLHFALVVRAGQVRGYYRSSEDESLAQLRAEVRKLLEEPRK